MLKTTITVIAYSLYSNFIFIVIVLQANWHSILI